MTGLELVTIPDVVVGYRLWRVMPFHRLDGSSTVRLCAMGSFGVPKVWEPRQRTTATCSKYASHHEAPWPDHECGLWALKDPESAITRLIEWLENFTTGSPAGFAIGEVSLWGRVIEHENGWRAQHAYPYSLTVHSEDRRVAELVRREYAVDVDWAGGALVSAAERKRLGKVRQAEALERKRREELDACIEGLRRLSSRRRESQEERCERDREERQKKWEAEREKQNQAVLRLSPVGSLEDVMVDDVLRAVVLLLGGNQGWYQREIKAGRLPAMSFDRCWGACEVLLEQREADWRFLGSSHGVVRRGVDAAEEHVKGVIEEARAAGLMERVHLWDNRHSHGRRDWLITRSGLDRVIAVGGTMVEPADRPFRRAFDKGEKGEILTVDLAARARKLRRLRRPLSVQQVDDLTPRWMEERRAAARNGRRAYRAWLDKRRRRGHPPSLWFTDEEVLAGVRRMKRPASIGEIAERLAPGDRIQSEAARFSYQFKRLADAGQLRRIGDTKPVLWEVAPNA